MDTNQSPDASTASDAEQEVGTRLRLAREERDFTQGAVANRTKMIDPEKRGISRTSLVGYEQGTSKPGLREIKLLCEVLRVSPNWLIYGMDSAAVAAQPSMELLTRSREHQLLDVLGTALALTAMKGHERDAIQSLVLSLAGRQLGDLRLSALMSTSYFLKDAFLTTLKQYAPEIESSSSLEEVAEFLSANGLITNAGNRFRLGEEGVVLNPESTLYPDPKS